MRRTDPGVPVQFGRYLADHIPGARLMEVDGADHAPWMTDPDRVADRGRGVPHGRPCGTSAVSTCPAHCAVHRHRRVDGTGGRGGRRALARHIAPSSVSTTDAAARFDGTVVKSTGDGHLVTFEGPTQAIRCAETLRDDAENLGIEIRIGSTPASAN